MSLLFQIPRGTRQVAPDYVGDGVATSFPFPYYFLDRRDVSVATLTAADDIVPQVLFLDNDYTVTGAGVAGGGTVVLAAPLAAGRLLRVMGRRVGSRLTSVINDGAVQSAPIEAELDAIELTLQELRRDVDALSLIAQLVNLARPHTRVVTASNTLILSALTDYRIGLQRLIGATATAVQLAADAVIGQEFVIQDLAGNFAAYPVVVSPPAGLLIANRPTVTLNQDLMTAKFVFYGTTWGVEL